MVNIGDTKALDNKYSHHEAGSGTALALGLIGAIAIFGVFLASLTAFSQARWQAQLAADLGAIACATAFYHGLAYQDVALETIRQNRASSGNCEMLEDGTFLVAVELRLGQFLNFQTVTAMARAGARF